MSSPKPHFLNRACFEHFIITTDCPQGEFIIAYMFKILTIFEL